MGQFPSRTVETKWGPAFEVEGGLSDGLTVWYNRTDWGDDKTAGKKLTAEQARELAQVLEEYAQMIEPASHA